MDTTVINYRSNGLKTYQVSHCGKVYQYWYDRYTRNWIGYLVDRDGNQLGNADYVYTREAIELCAASALCWHEYRHVEGRVIRCTKCGFTRTAKGDYLEKVKQRG